MAATQPATGGRPEPDDLAISQPDCRRWGFAAPDSHKSVRPQGYLACFSRSSSGLSSHLEHCEGSAITSQTKAMHAGIAKYQTSFPPMRAPSQPIALPRAVQAMSNAARFPRVRSTRLALPRAEPVPVASCIAVMRSNSQSRAESSEGTTSNTDTIERPNRLNDIQTTR